MPRPPPGGRLREVLHNGAPAGQVLRAAYAAALIRLAIVRADIANIRSSGNASAGLMCCRQVVAGVR